MSVEKHKEMNPTVHHLEDGGYSLISLNLILSYPVKWNKYKVLRDFVQNFYDAVSYEKWGDDFIYRIERNSMILESKGIGFSYDWLIHIGASTKREKHGKYAGYFGEGFKIAALCALRDFGWQIKMSSHNWDLKVATTDIKVDHTYLKSLAYHVRRKRYVDPNSVMEISPFSKKDEEIFRSVLLSFFYPENPLFGKRIWSSEDGAVYIRSDIPKPDHYPSTFQYRGEGIIFSGYQALGSFPFPLIFCIHDYHFDDRERNNFYRMDVIKVIHRLVGRMSPKGSFIVLLCLRKLWYRYPKKKYDFESWYEIIKGLIIRIKDSDEYCRNFRSLFPDLLVAKRIKHGDTVKVNRRSQALDWLKKQEKRYKLVQDGFLWLDYPELEEVCEKHGGFSIVRDPNKMERKYINLLEQAMLSLFGEYLYEKSLPRCKIIKEERAVWRGMASCIKLSNPRQTPSGHQERYDLPFIAMKSSIFQKGRFSMALSTYLHEKAHAFGGDRSKRHSDVLTDMLEVSLVKCLEIERFRRLWDEME